MAVSFAAVPNVVVNDVTPGATQTFNVNVSADQPPTSATGSVSVEFDGETVTAPLNFEFNTAPLVPQVTVDVGTATNIALTVGTPTQSTATVWAVPITLTVL